MKQRNTTSPKTNIEKEKQENADIIAIALSALLGANIVKKSDYDLVNLKKQELIKKVKI